MIHTLSSRPVIRGMLLTALLLGMAGCASHTSVVDTWENEQHSAVKPEKVAVIVVLPDALTRLAVEKDVVKMLNKKNHNTVVSSEIRGMKGGIRGEIDPGPAAAALRKVGVDGVIVMFYTGGGTSGTYSRSDYWARYEGTAVGYGGYSWGRPYFTEVYSVQKGPGYADFTESALVESTYYDLDAGEPIWRMVTKTKDIRNTDVLKEISSRISSEMRSAGL